MDMHSGQDDYAAPYPNIVLNNDRLDWLEALFAHRDIRVGEFMVPIINFYTRSHHHIFADPYVAVYLGVFSDTGVIAYLKREIESDMRFKIHIVSARSDEPFCNTVPKRFINSSES